MTRNFYRDGPAKPGELWCTAARSPKGEFGILIACGDVVVTFVPEEHIEKYLLKLVETGTEEPMGAQGINMIRAAQQGLPKFKAAHQATNN